MVQKDIEFRRLIGEPRMCLVRESQDENGHFDILAPGVGLYDSPPAPGTYITPGSFVGYLTVIRKYYHLVVPENHHGIVTHLHVESRKQQVEYGQPLFTVSPMAEAGFVEEFEGGKPKKETGEDLEGAFAILSPTDGIFYRRPNPQSAPYVKQGSEVRHGTILALVEVMKCFNPIIYPGEPEFPAVGKVKHIVPEDATEVKHGSPLFIIEPA